jgi:serine/threonine protein kinase/tetratricopeptide (TPR) repeat protein
MIGDESEDSRAEAGDSTETLRPTDTLPEHIGPYRVLNKIGEGGMGIVYAAEQKEPVRRKVALKIIKHGMDTKQVVARFESERQALALMNHPNVARVYDAGSTPRGRPYFAMEHVEGVPITEFCDRHRLTMNERLEVFMQACEGVRHAHQKAIIHRDIKPSNVLVSTQDGQRVAKIIDFGVAKATAQRLTERTLFTEQGQLIGTPGYMSPEQAEMTTESVDTRTDVYSLGVLLYELLVGTPPFNPQELRAAGIDEMRRRICEEEPPKPSTRLSTLGDASEESAARRRSDPRALVRVLRGDLDWITMKALEKDRTHRYSSSGDLVADIARYLNDEPVQAGPPSTLYRIRKFARRHRIGVTAAGLVMLALLVGIAGTTFGLIRAKRAERQAQAAERRAVEEAERTRHEAETVRQVSSLLLRVFEVSDPRRGRLDSDTVQEILDEGALQVSAELENYPLIQARLKGTIGRVYRSLGMYDRAEGHLTESLAIRERLLGPDDPVVAINLVHLAWVLLFKQDFVRAGELVQRAYQIQTDALDPDHPDLALTLIGIGILHSRAGQLEKAKEMHSRALAIAERHPERVDPGTAWAADNLAALLVAEGRFDEAERLGERAAEMRQKTQGPENADEAGSAYIRAALLIEQGDHAGARDLLERALTIQQEAFGFDHPERTMNLVILGSLLLIERDFPGAKARLYEALAIDSDNLGPDQRPGQGTLVEAFCLSGLSSIYKAEDRPAEAETSLLRSLEIFERLVGEQHGLLLAGRARLAALKDDRDEALSHLRQAADKGVDLRNIDLLPEYEFLQGDPGFEAIITEANKKPEKQ